MKTTATILAATALVAAVPAARAALAPGEIAGRWSSERDCRATGFSYVRSDGGLLHVVEDGARSFRTPVSVRVEGGLLRVTVDEKVFTFRLPTPDTLQALSYTDTRNGLSVEVAPRTWYRCSEGEARG
jgi:hypothetical protein